MMRTQIDIIVSRYTNPKLDWEEWDVEEMNKEVNRMLLPDEEEYFTPENMTDKDISELKDMLYESMQQVYNAKITAAAEIGCDFEEVERIILLKPITVIDGNSFDGQQMD